MKHSNDKEIIRLGEMFFHKLRRRLLAAKNHEDELRSAIYEGILRAYQTYDPTKSGFSTYAFNWALAYARKAVKEAVETVHVPDYHRNAWHTTASLDEPFDFEGSQSTLLDFVTTENKDYENIEARRTIESVLAKAEELEIEWCQQRPGKCSVHSAVGFWVQLQQGSLLQDVAEKNGVSREYVRVLSNRGMVFIQEALGATKKCTTKSLSVTRKMPAEKTPDLEGRVVKVKSYGEVASHNFPEIMWNSRKAEQLSLAF